ncbi:jacalin-like lectin [Streptomyces sp. NBC_01390]|uniref:jacalin-like lectin n=1 Tax=Streptomyces sp. NBC_01390 TaxID=2903850 RepID=UPI00324B9390
MRAFPLRRLGLSAVLAAALLPGVLVVSELPAAAQPWSNPFEFGGHGGNDFTDAPVARDGNYVSNVTIRTGDRVDQVGLRFRNGTQVTHGGNGGTLHTLNLYNRERVISVEMCASGGDGRRLTYIRFTTDRGRTLSGGRRTGDCVTVGLPRDADHTMIGGFHGAAGANVDRLGFIYTGPRS